MKNLPVFTQDLLKGCKVFAIVGALSLCCACGGGEQASTPEGETTASPMSGEVEVKGDEVASTSGEATAEEGASGETATEGTESATGGEVADASAGEAASDSSEKPAEPEAQKEPERKVMSVGKVRDPFDKYYGAPAIGTSLSGGVKPSSDKGNIGVNSAVKKKLAKKGKKGGADDKPVVKVSKPDVKVTGILRSGSTYQAILQGPEKAIMVTAGEKIGGYRVASVTPKDVTLVYKNKYKFVIPLEKEVFGSTGTSAPKAGLNTNSGADAASAVSAPVIEITK